MADILAYLSLTLTGSLYRVEDGAFERALNKPPHRVGKKTADLIKACRLKTEEKNALTSRSVGKEAALTLLNEPGILSDSARFALESFFDLVRRLRVALLRESLPDLVEYMWQTTGLSDWCKNRKCKSRKTNDDEEKDSAEEDDDTEGDDGKNSDENDSLPSQMKDLVHVAKSHLGVWKTSEPPSLSKSAEITSFSMDVIKASDFGASVEPQPNGIYAEEACQMLRYVGLAEKTKAVLITDISGENAIRRDDLLIAQMIWCFIDGFYSRKTEIPGGKSEGFLKYRVPLRNDEFQLIFYKSIATDRWWMEVPVPPQYANKYRKHHLVACSYEDYLIATRDDLPERWWKAYKKML